MAKHSLKMIERSFEFKICLGAPGSRRRTDKQDTASRAVILELNATVLAERVIYWYIPVKYALVTDVVMNRSWFCSLNDGQMVDLSRMPATVEPVNGDEAIFFNVLTISALVLAWFSHDGR